MKDEFKSFVKEHPSLVKYVNNNTMTWQKFYEMYNLYGKDDSVWNTYLNENSASKVIGIADIITWFKNIDLDALEENINNVKRVVGVLQDLGTKDETPKYNPRPIYKHFED